MKERVISATEARVHFGEVIRRVAETNEVVIVERGGKPQVVIVSLEQYQRIDTTDHAPSWLDEVRDLHELLLNEPGERPRTEADAVIREMREERSRHFDDLR